MSTHRRGWRERIEKGLYRSHRVSCRSTQDRRPDRRCQCPFELIVPGVAPGKTRTVMHPGPVTDARAERRRLLGDGRPRITTATAPGTLNELAAAYFRAKAPVLASNTIRNREDDYRLRIAPELGDLALVDLTRERLEEFVAVLTTRSQSLRMIVQTVATLRAILATAVEWARLTENPAVRLTLPRPTPSDADAVRRVLDRDQLAELVAATGTTRTETMIRAAGEGALRRGEVAGLRWIDVDLAERRLNIRRNIIQERLTTDTPMRKVEQGPKNNRDRRVAISEHFAQRLGDWYAQSVVEKGADASSYVWPGRDGGPMNDGSLHQAVERACTRAGLLNEEGKPIVTPHGLRHTAASIMLAAGVPLIVVSRQLGHANPHVTATIYAHLLGDHQLDLAASAFASAIVTETLGETLGGHDHPHVTPDQ